VLQKDRLTALYGVPVRLGVVAGNEHSLSTDRENPVFDPLFKRLALAASIALGMSLGVMASTWSSGASCFWGSWWRTTRPWEQRSPGSWAGLPS
jgi:hypothetical protein